MRRFGFDASCELLDCGSIIIHAGVHPRPCPFSISTRRRRPAAIVREYLRHQPTHAFLRQVLIGRHQQNGAGVLARKIRCFYELFFGDLSKAREANAFESS